MTKYEVLKKYFGYDAFREGQEPLVDALLSGQDAMGIIPTGAGRIYGNSYPRCHAGLSDEERRHNQDDFLNDQMEPPENADEETAAAIRLREQERLKQ